MLHCIPEKSSYFSNLKHPFSIPQPISSLRISLLHQNLKFYPSTVQSQGATSDLVPFFFLNNLFAAPLIASTPFPTTLNSGPKPNVHPLTRTLQMKK